ncbi:hypothetical protein KEF29_16755 [Streptomyces tuirus]|uniref:Uncharacterized protein n=1 Tax=Streptomyces tuirus TaxID=68278 RepID=A0A941FAG6_9ACTN|nr:hypothetical protein [Streptomyces tuirus]
MSGLVWFIAGQDHAVRGVRGMRRELPAAESVGLPQGECRADRIDQRRHAALVACLEGRKYEARAVGCRSFGASVDVVDRQVVGDVRGSVRWVDRIREVAHTADLVTVGGEFRGLAPVGFEVHPAERVHGGSFVVRMPDIG